MLSVFKALVEEGVDLHSPAVASRLDAADTLASFRNEFHMPLTESTAEYRTPASELSMQSLPWATIEDSVRDGMAAVVGALPSEVCVMNTLTTNLHLLMAAFYKPTPDRYKILIEDHAFPSDTYAVKSQVLFHGYKIEDAVILAKPREGEELLRTEDIQALIETHGKQLALVMLPGVQYYTGQVLDMRVITEMAHAVGAAVGFDCAHAVGNYPLRLHDWNVDFAVWCSYKYLNSGPGGIAGAFVHDRFANESLEQRPFFAGWWGHDRSTRFKMGDTYIPMPGAARFQLSNPPVFQTAALRASLEVFTRAGGMDVLREKSLALTGYLEALLAELDEDIKILTPKDPNFRGCQLSLEFKRGNPRAVYKALQREGIIADFREPNVIRVAPTPLYNTAADVLEFVATVKLLLREVAELPTDSAAASNGGAGEAAFMRPGAAAE